MHSKIIENIKCIDVDADEMLFMQSKPKSWLISMCITMTKMIVIMNVYSILWCIFREVAENSWN